MATNAEGVGRLVAAARKRAPELRRFVYVSSLAATGPSEGARPMREDDAPRPVSAYGRSKLSGEVRLREGAGPIPWTIIRPPLVYGPRERDLLAMFRCAARGWAPLVADGRYSVVHVDDLAAAIEAVIASPATVGEVYHVAEERAYGGREMLTHVGAAVGRAPRVVPIPSFLATAYAAAGSLAARFRSRPPFVTLDKLPELRRSWVCSADKLVRACGFRCTIPFAEGARATADWYRREGWL
jgi:nucleoside-diphosphate-sugar epimerase